MHGDNRVQARASPALDVQLLVLERLQVGLDRRQEPGGGSTGGGPAGGTGAVDPAGRPPAPVVVPPLPVTGPGLAVGAPEPPPAVAGGPAPVPLPAEPPAVVPVPVVVPLPVPVEVPVPVLVGVPDPVLVGVPDPVLVGVPDPVLVGPVGELSMFGASPFIMWSGSRLSEIGITAMGSGLAEWPTAVRVAEPSSVGAGRFGPAVEAREA